MRALLAGKDARDNKGKQALGATLIRLFFYEDIPLHVMQQLLPLYQVRGP